MTFRKWVFPSVIVVLAAASCIRLGFWQLDRLQQRRNFNQHYLSMKALETLELPSKSPLEDMEFRSASATGEYLFEEQVAILNQSHQGTIGYHLLTPLVLSDGSAIMVDRGWIPADGNPTRNEWTKYDLSGEVVVTGVIRRSREKADITGKTDPALDPGQIGMDYWLFPNIYRIQEQVRYPLLPVYIQIVDLPTGTAGPIPAELNVEISEGPHLGYALQWFTFSVILLVGYPVYIKKQTGKKS